MAHLCSAPITPRNNRSILGECSAGRTPRVSQSPSGVQFLEWQQAVNYRASYKEAESHKKPSLMLTVKQENSGAAIVLMFV